VERLGGMDAAMLYMETPTLHTHTLKVAVLQPRSAGDFRFELARAQLAACLPLLPGFRRRVVELPLGFHHPVWVEDEHFQIEAHVHRIGAPPPGGRAELDGIVSQIASRPLDRRRPLWEVWFVEGLAEGRIAAVAKIHHAVADGMAAAHMLAHVTSESPDAPPPHPRDAWRPEPGPATQRLLGDALRDHARRALRVPRLAAHAARGIAALMRRQGPGPRPPRPLLDTPRTLFNTSITSQRVFVSADLSLAEVKSVRKHFGVTVNDVLLALVAGSVRDYLSARDALPPEPLVAEVPVSTRSPDDASPVAGNRVSNLFTSLRTDLADPAERLRAIHEVTDAAKRAHERLGADLYGELSEYAPPPLYRWWMQRLTRGRLADRIRPPVNLIVSSVPGPRQALYFAGARLRDLYSVGPILEGVGLNVTMWSYLDRVYAGVLACPDRLSDVDEIAEGLARELAALLRAVR
jgi:diacylglycerol O-acyltransferase / wax synthase